ncbi:MAG TPA: hypothetical protein VMT46_16805 [Anaerolineaceae bacterium]|nr:hypothetical protein [Anaerolineaceae bacterium]
MPLQKYLTKMAYILCLVATACQPTPEPTPSPKIPESTAVEIAKGACKEPHLVMMGEPKNIRFQLLTLGEADRLTKSENETTFNTQTLDTKVWLVQMDGELQLVGGPAPVPSIDPSAPTPTPPQPFQGTCSVILDATSGSVIVVRG